MWPSMMLIVTAIANISTSITNNSFILVFIANLVGL